MSPLQPVAGPEPYPKARHAIRLMEQIQGLDPHYWAKLRQTGRSIDDLVAGAKRAFSNMQARGSVDRGMEQAAAEFDTMDFRAYLRAVVYGAM